MKRSILLGAGTALAIVAIVAMRFLHDSETPQTVQQNEESASPIPTSDGMPNGPSGLASGDVPSTQERSAVLPDLADSRKLSIRVIEKPSEDPFTYVQFDLIEQRAAHSGAFELPGSGPMPEDLPTRRNALTDKNGVAVLEDVKAGHYRVSLKINGLFSDARGFDVGEEREQSVTVAVRWAVGVTGLVLTSDARPVVGAMVRAGGEEVFESDSTGRYTLKGLDPGPWVEGQARTVSVHVVDQTFVHSKEVKFDVHDGMNEVPPIVLDLPSGHIQGRILDEAGRPIPDALVYCSGGPGNLDRAAHTRTEADGRFALAGLDSGRFAVHCDAICLSQPPNVDVTTGATADVGDLKGLARDVELRGIALLEDGSPAVGAQVSFRGNDGTTDSNGQWILHMCVVGPGDIELRWKEPRDSDNNWVQIERAVRPGETPLRVVLVRRGLVVRLVDAATRGELKSHTVQFAMRDSAARQVTQITGEFKGEWRLDTDRIATGRVSLTVSAQDYREAVSSFEIPAGGFTRREFLEIALERN